MHSIEASSPIGESLDLKIRVELEMAVLELFGIKHGHNKETAEWIGKYNDKMHDIVELDENVKSLTRAGKIEEAALLVKEQLDQSYSN